MVSFTETIYRKKKTAEQDQTALIVLHTLQHFTENIKFFKFWVGLMTHSHEHSLSFNPRFYNFFKVTPHVVGTLSELPLYSNG